VEGSTVKKILIVMFVVLLCAVALGACSSESEEASIIGTWECQGASEPLGILYRITFYEDGRFDEDGLDGTFQVEDNVLSLEYSFIDHGLVFGFSISGDQLILTNGDIRIELVRQ